MAIFGIRFDWGLAVEPFASVSRGFMYYLINGEDWNWAETVFFKTHYLRVAYGAHLTDLIDPPIYHTG